MNRSGRKLLLPGPSPAEQLPRAESGARSFSVEEELLLVDTVDLEPSPAGEQVAAMQDESSASGHRLSTAVKQEQIAVSCPPQTISGQLAAIRAGRSLAADAAARVGGAVVALPTAPGPVIPHAVPEQRYRRISEQLALTAVEQFTNGFHIRVGIDTRQEAVVVLDRIRVWLPVLLALSANSPFWDGADTGYGSYRYQVWSRLPTAGPTDVFGSTAAYRRHRQALLNTRVPLDPWMLYFDARLSEHRPAVEVRVADVCLHAERAAVLATLVRALVETAARGWRAAPPDVPASVLRAWCWRASRSGVEESLIDPLTGTPAPAGDVVARLVDTVRPVLAEDGDDEAVEAVLADTLRSGTGSRRQREVYRQGGDLRAVVRAALQSTHQAPTVLPEPGEASSDALAEGNCP
ncbi:glutamate--cysteine ligase [Tersicoccus phoenicis]|uniref:glutamate--cysteine ligase n=1 Tax=Tersicoccus phoenicis TaxID=554083 RepID=UPI0009FBADDF|nr:glutamate--cysteine ligase [Tersicoccus phoenicis]